MIETILLSIGLVAIAVVGLALSLILKKGGRFPDTHIGHNKAMRKRGIVCAKTWDRMEQKRGSKPLLISPLKVIPANFDAKKKTDPQTLRFNPKPSKPTLGKE